LISNNSLAGSDTTATAIRSTMLYLMTSHLAYRKLQEEIDRFIADGQISSPISDAEGRKLPYLQAVIKEGLRIYPPVTGLMFKTVPKGGDNFGGVFVPGGTDIGYCAWGVHHSKAIFGEDADMFRPERWLEADGEKLRIMQSTVDLVFNYGKWQCPGKSIALIELNKIFVEVCLTHPMLHLHLQYIDVH
jgi:cytochrome P450